MRDATGNSITDQVRGSTPAEVADDLAEQAKAEALIATLGDVVGGYDLYLALCTMVRAEAERDPQWALAMSEHAVSVWEV